MKRLAILALTRRTRSRLVDVGMLELNNKAIADDGVCAAMLARDGVNAYVDFDVLERGLLGQTPFRLAVGTSTVAFSIVTEMQDADAASCHKLKLGLPAITVPAAE